MKGLFRALLPTLLLLAIIMALAGCTKKLPEITTECDVHSFDSGVITKGPSCGSDGVRTYTCSVCGETKTESIPATGEHQFGEEFEIIEDATCDKAGTKRFTCSVCGATRDEEIPTVEAHIFDEGVVTVPPTCYEEGVRAFTCTICGFVSEEVEPVAEPAFILTMEGFGEYLVPESGVYKLSDPEKVGYEFEKWTDAEGNDFPSEGIISEDVTVIPVFLLLDTKTVEELEERAAGGAEVIKIVNDIVIDRPIYVTGSTRIYSEKAVKLIRDENYFGDLFVIGMDKDGNSSILMCLTPKLTLGSEDYEGDEILLTIDGNRGNMSEGKEVVGTALFLINSARVNMYRGVSISNHEKLGNERLSVVESFHFKASSTVGGAAAMIATGSSFYMYGGIMENNSARTVAVADANGTLTYFSGYGGAVYNNGTFKMMGGVIKNCEANRGGAIYTNKIVNIEAGLLEGNYASNKGGAVCSSGSDTTDIFIGLTDAAADTVIFRENSAAKQGGAILSYADSPIVLFGGVLFERNAALSSNGGAISTSGPITSYNNKFVGNTAKYSGGAIYQTYGSADASVRIVELHNTVFEGNSANKGGAVMLTSSGDSDVGSSAKIYDCKFIENSALCYFTEKTDSETGEVKTSISGGNGGAIYSSQKSSFYIENCEFEGNKSENLGGGAIGATVSSKITVNNSVFKNNSSVDVNGEEGGRSGVGGAIYAYNGSTLTVNDSVFDGNSAYKNGGAIYLSDNTAKLNNVEFVGNSAGLNGGAIVQLSGNILEIRGISAYGNSAASGGGVIYNSKSTLNIIAGEDYENIFGAVGEDEEKTAALANTAANGGALCAGNASVMNIGGATFVNNAAIQTVTNIYDETTGKITGTSTSDGYGGAIYAVYGSVVKIKDSEFDSNSAKYGGAFSLSSDNTVLEVKNASFESNSSTNCGGVLYALSATATFDNVDVTENVSAKGGAFYLSSKSDTTVIDSTFSENAGTLGGAVYASGSEAARFESVEFIGNGPSETKPTKSGGAIYIISATVDVADCDFDGNIATSGGGAIYLAATEKKVDSAGVETKTRIAELNSADTVFKNNSARNGGAISASTDAAVALDKVEFAGNTAKGTDADGDARGGAIYMLGAALTADKVEFNGNHADYYGGAIDAHTGSTGILDDVRFLENSSLNNGGAIWMYTNTQFDITGIYACGNTSGSAGGFVYTRGVLSIHADEAFGNVFEGVAEGEDALKNAKNGGAVYCGVSSLVSIESVELKGLSASSGGAIYVAGDLKAKNCEFTGNTATNGGAVYIEKTAELDTCIFTENEASYHGGAINVAYDENFKNELKADIKNSQFVSNKAIVGGENEERRGGAIYIGEYSVVKVNDTAFENNAATQYGGAISVARGSVLQVSDSSFRSSEATNGGAIWLYSESSLEALNGEFSNNSATGDGGAIFSYSAVDVTGVEFKNNTAKVGGAISVAGGSTTAKNCSFIGNGASNGGAIYVVGKAYVSGGAFTENTASNDGGAVYIVNEEKYTGENKATFDGVTFSSNKAIEGGSNDERRGGAIYIAEYVAVSVNNSTFTENIATQYGGAIDVARGSSISITDTAFNKNEATNGGAVWAYLGSAIEISGGELSDNIAKTNGGAIYSYGEVVATNVRFLRNSAAFGGAYYASNGGVTADGCLFRDNSSSSNGGAIYLYSNTVNNISGSVLEANSANRGGAVYVGGGDLTVNDSQFNANTVTRPETGGETARGGAIFTQSGNISVTGAKFNGNIAESNAGAIVANSENAKYTLENVEFTGNITTGGNGGAIWLYGGATVDIKGIVAKGNKAENGYGGVIYVTNGKLTVLSGEGVVNTFGGSLDGEGNVADNGGAIGGAGSLDITGASFIGNSASYGGAIYTTSTASTADCTFTGNVAKYYGGAVCVKENASYSDSSSAFGENTAIYGGAIYLYKVEDAENNPDHVAAHATVVGSVFDGNIATTAGGAIHISTGATLSTEGASFNSNSASKGGAVNLSSSSSQYTDNNSTFTLNVATTGEGGAINSTGILKLTGTQFIENKTEAEGKRGGAIYLTAGYIDADGVVFDGNSAVNNGGALIITGAERAYFNNCIFKNNSSGYRGGAFYATQTGDVKTTSCEFTSNVAVNRGGAVYLTTSAEYVDGDSEIENSNSVFRNNNSVVGGALFADKAATLNGTVFEDNTVVSSDETVLASGGAVASDYGTITINNASFIGNTAELGGAIYGEKKVTYNLNGAIFKENSATLGGAIYGAVVNANDCSFISNSATEKGGAVYVAENSKFNYTANEKLTFTEGVADATYAGPKFDGNLATNGAAIYIAAAETEGAAAGKATVSGATFMNHSTTGSGGVVYFGASSVDNVINNSVFYRNASNKNGSAFYMSSKAEVTADGLMMVENSANRGGAVYLGGGTLTISNSEFLQNKAIVTEGGETARGAAIFVNSGTLNATGVKFNENVANSNGGALVTNTSSAKAYLNNVEFIGNVSENGNGGAIWIYGSSIIDVKGIVAKGNKAENGYGGVVYLSSGTLNVLWEEGVVNVFGGELEGEGNIAKNGGVIGNSGAININGASFIGNSSSLTGGAIYTGGSANIADSTFRSNNAGTNGGAFYVNGNDTVTKGCTLTGNTATMGGAVYVAKGTYTDGELVLDGENVTVAQNGSTFSGNVAENGGAIYVAGGTANAFASVFTENSVKANVAETTDAESGVITSTKTYPGNGGAVYVASGAVYNDINADYSGNIAALGGAIYTVGGTVNSANSTFTENASVTSETTATNTEAAETTAAYGKGGAIYIAENGKFNYTANEKLTFTDGVADETYAGPKFDGNLAANGAAIYIAAAETDGAKPGNITVIGATFMNHVTTGSGSAIYFSTGSINNVINDTVFYKNASDIYGAAIYIASEVSLSSKGLIVVENSANRGGAIFMNGGTFTVNDSEFSKNVAAMPEGKTTTARAGAIFVQEGTFNANGVKFIENSAESHGGAMVANSKNAKFYLENVEFIGNTTGENAGAIWLYSNATVEITGIVAKGNRADNGYGGFAYLSSGTLSILAGEGVINVFGGELEGEGNTAKNGGVIGNAGTINIDGASFIGNSATTNGGAIHTTGAANINDSEFRGNSAKLGGAVYVNGSTTVTKGCIFTENSATTGGAIYVAKGTYTDGDAVLDGENVIDSQNGSTFSNNDSTGTELGGGAIYSATGAVLYGSEFVGNTSKFNGGAVYSVGDLTVYHSDFTENQSSGSGGAIYIIGDVELLVVGGIMKNNKTASSKNGGAICAYENEDKIGPTCTIRGTVFDGNSSYSGGALSLRNQGEAKTEHLLENITLINNKGGNGAVYIYNNTKVTVSGLVADNNVSTNNGSVFYVTSSKAPALVIKDAQISGNSDKSDEINFVYIANKTAVVDIYTDKISGDDFTAAGITDITDVTSAGWEKLIKNASNGTINGYTTPVNDGSGDSSQQ